MEYNSTILIVDDEQIGRSTLEALLFAQGYNLIFAGNGYEALAKAAEFKPDVILLDVMMPGLDGYEVCRKLRADPLLAEAPIIMVTALDDQESRLQGIVAGADDFISKPFDRMELRARIRTISRLNRYHRLLSERAKFEWVVDQADDGYLMLTADDEIIYANPQARSYLGLSTAVKEAIPEPFLALTSKNRYHYKPQEAWDNWPDRPSTSSPRYLVQPASSTSDAFWLQVDLIEMDADPDKKYLIRLRDVTTKVSERRLQWAFHGQVSHKLRTPLALLDGFLSLLAETDSNLSEAEEKDFRSRAHSSAIQLQHNILDIFQYMNAPDITGFRQGRCNLAEISDLVTKIARNLELESPSVIYTQAYKALDERCIPLSYQAVELILTELLENAQKFHPNQTPALEVKISEQPVGICIQVVDNGLTLSAEQLSKIWLPYYQAERGFSGQVPGMGLGLSTVASLVWGAGGACRAYNRAEGPGLVVELTLPAVQGDEA